MHAPAQPLTGLWFDGKCSHLHAATLSLDEHGSVTLWVEGAAHSSFPLHGLTISNRISNTRRSIRLPQGDSFDTDDNDAVDIWQKQLRPRYRNAIHRFESTWPLMLLMLCVLGLGASWVVLQGLADASDAIAEKLPASIGIELGKRSLAALDEEVFLPSRLDAKGQKQVRNYFQSALKKFPAIPMNIVIRDGGSMGPNALALPDGTLVFTDQLIALAQSQEELMAVLAHEIGHVLREHSLRSAVRNALTNVAMLALSGKASLNSDLLLSAPLYMLDMSYSRKFEEDADNFALEFLLDNGLSPKYFTRIMSRMERAETCIPDEENTPDEYDDYYNQTIACYRKLATLSRDEILALPAPIADAQSTSTFWGYMSSHPTTPERLKKFSE